MRAPGPADPAQENPASYRVFDSDDAQFAHQVAGVTLEEWNAFKCHAERERQLSEREQPFERVKPSVRKAYERRLKAAEATPEALLD